MVLDRGGAAARLFAQRPGVVDGEDAAAYAAHLARYIHKEAVKEGLAAKPEDYRWSSAAQYLGAAQGPAEPGLVLNYFSADPAEAAAKYAAFLAETAPGKFWRPFDKNRDAVIGDADFEAAHSPHDRP